MASAAPQRRERRLHAGRICNCHSRRSAPFDSSGASVDVNQVAVAKFQRSVLHAEHCGNSVFTSDDRSVRERAAGVGDHSARKREQRCPCGVGEGADQHGAGGWVVGAGPVFLYPSATDSDLGGEKWGVGPTAVVLREQGGWTDGALVNHLESFAGESHRRHVSATFLQPFPAYACKTFTALTLDSAVHPGRGGRDPRPLLCYESFR